MRIFIGIKLPDCLEEIVKIQEELKIQDPQAYYTKRENIHLTLAFLGELNTREVVKLKSILERIRHPSFEIAIVKAKRMRDMAVLEVRPDFELLSLQSLLEDNLRKAGFKLEERRFYPHVTLSRKTTAAVDGVFSLKSAVREVILFSSERNESGLLYRLLYLKKLDIRTKAET